MKGTLEKQHEVHLLPSNVCLGLERILSLTWMAVVFSDSDYADIEHLREALLSVHEVADSLLFQFDKWKESQPDGKLYEVFGDFIITEPEPTPPA